ncbi:unnamed protein product [Adineta ricciae]|uniref:Uncharacterized protein n=1 Tax=Adineta ricciae TaxID=249248 RepID=A0A815S062_ADIRI|nr:unnamed protein product [Adineta ricciae]CAF1496843.1 unnamed protein product [Adineta ricciae]
MSASLQFNSRPSADHNAQTKANALEIIDMLPYVIQILVKPLASLVLNYVLKVDDNYTVDVADEHLSDSEAYTLLRSLGAHIENLKSLNLTNYFDTDSRNFKKTISGAGDLNKYVDDIVQFCSSYRQGHINTTAIKNILTSLLKTEMEEERLKINKTENVVIHSTRYAECGVMRLTFTGDQIKKTNCCSDSAETNITVEKVVITFRNTKDLLALLRTFVQANH